MLDIQKLIYEKLTALGYTVYDYVVEDAAFPHIRLGVTDGSNNNTKNTKGKKIKQYIDVFSSYRGTKEVKEITSKIVDVLDGLSADGYTFTLDYATVIQEEYKPLGGTNKGTIFHSVIIFEIKSY